jgi:hypothetical protein
MSQRDPVTVGEPCARIRLRKGDVRDIYRELPPDCGAQTAGALDLGLAKRPALR